MKTKKDSIPKANAYASGCGNKRIDFHYREVFLVLLAFVLVCCLYYYLTKPDWGISGEGIVYYSPPRYVQYEKIFLNDTDTESVYKIIFESRGAKVYGLLRVPKSDKKIPGVVILPGAGVSKEGETETPDAISKIGYATLTIDQRDTGETRKYSTDGFDTSKDIGGLKNNKEPVSYKMIFDAVNAYHLMKQFDEIDSSKISLVGISNGGRMAIIAAAIDPEIKGVIGISTAGFGIPQNANTDEGRFFKSIDPDSYVGGISPRKVVMIHSKNDPVIPFERAEITFSKANEPKEFVTVACENHGYCSEMLPYLKKGLDGFFGENGD